MPRIAVVALGGNAIIRAGQAGTHREQAANARAVVSVDDPAFDRPSKPIGPFFPETEAKRLAAERGWEIVEDSGRGYRQIVASPKPLRIVEIEAVRALVDREMIVIAAGGGGVPVVEDGRGYRGVEGVIDKDLTARLMASAVGAEALVLVTDVDKVALDFGTDRRRSVTEMTADEAQSHLEDHQFPPGSMGPKVSAAIEFIRGGGRIAVITNAQRVRPSLDPEAGDAAVGSRIVAASTTSIGAAR
ncbi:MAG: hypothetical protein LC722_06195 [Actinobacteria bacterium]|nr:hypothetical protein [Actinomycetota bacterium]